MAPHATSLLALVLFLGETIHTQEGALPRPSISAEPGSVIPRGRPVTIVCHGPAGAETFRLVKMESYEFKDENVSPSDAEARFLLPSMSEDTAGHYYCLYLKSSWWSEFSEDLKLVLSSDDVTQAPTPAPAQSSDSSSPGAARTPSEDSDKAATPARPDLATRHLCIVIKLSLAFLLLLLLLFCLHQWKQGHPGGNGQEQRPQQRLGLAADSLEGSSGVATGDRLPAKDRETDNFISAAGGPQEVTYVQLVHQALTQKVALPVSPLTTEHRAESSTYATLSRY